jgi:hypothetical protein
VESGLFEFWLRFSSATGRCGHAPSPKPRQNSKILARTATLFLKTLQPRRAGVGSDFGRAVSRILSSFLRTERIICLSSQYPKPVPVKGRGAGSSPVSYLALHPMGFSVPPGLLPKRWAITPPFHPYPAILQQNVRAVCFLWHSPSKGRYAFRPRVSRRTAGLRGIAPCGVRTFLPRPASGPGAILRPSKIA